MQQPLGGRGLAKPPKHHDIEQGNSRNASDDLRGAKQEGEGLRFKADELGKLIARNRKDWRKPHDIPDERESNNARVDCQD